MKVVFVVSDLSPSGGVNVILTHAQGLAETHKHEVYIATLHNSVGLWANNKLSKVNVIPYKEAQTIHFEVVIATFWETLFHMANISASRYLWFCQSLEDRFYPEGSELKPVATATMRLPIPVVTEATWIQNTLLQQNKSREIYLVLNGIDKGVFNYNAQNAQQISDTGKLKVLLEGPLKSVTKGTELALLGALQSTSPVQITHITNNDAEVFDPRYKILKGPLSHSEMANAYREHDLIIKTSKVEGMFGPPLEAFHCGSTAIVTPVTGHEEYIQDGINSLLTPWDNPQALARQIDRLNFDRNLLRKLKKGAISTADRWPSWPESTSQFNSILESLVSSNQRLSQTDYQAMLWAVRSLRISLAQLHASIRALESKPPETVVRRGFVTRVILADHKYWVKLFIKSPLFAVTHAYKTSLNAS